MPVRPLVKWLAAPFLLILAGVAAFLVGAGAGAPPSPGAAQEPVTEAWVARYDGPSSQDDYALALAVDGAGNVYVTGESRGSGITTDYATIKYGPDGSQQWAARYDGPAGREDGASGLAVDGSGNVYVTGASKGPGSFWDYATIKYGPDGSQQWLARYDGPVSALDIAAVLAVDGSGNVYVTGQSEGPGTIPDYATIKYGPDGTQQWVARYDGPASGLEAAFAVAVDGSGNVYVTGQSEGPGTGPDYATIKYGPDGRQQWAARYSSPGSGEDSYDRAEALAVDGSGNVYVTGYGRTIKYGPDGTEEWAAPRGGQAIAVDASGNAYVAAGAGTVKYGPDGSEQWQASYPGSASRLALDGSGNVYVTGWSEGSGTGYDYATVKYGPDGTQQWVARYDGPGGDDDDDYPQALAVDGSGNVYVTGFSEGSGTERDYATIKYSQAPPPTPSPPPPPPPPGDTEDIPLEDGTCNPVASTYPDATPIATIAGAVAPPNLLEGLWEFDGVTWLGYSPHFPAASNLTQMNQLDVVFICVGGSGPGAAMFTRPVI